MNIAILFSGQLRNWKETFPHFKKMYENNSINPDIYIHIWKDDASQYSEIAKNYSPRTIAITDYGTIDNIISKRTKELEKFHHKPTGNYSLKTGLLIQHYTVKKAFQLIDNPFSYNLILRCRFDWTPQFIMPWEEIYQICSTEDVLLFSNKKTHGLRQTKFTINDMFAIGTPQTMSVYCELFDRMMEDTYLSIINETQCFIPEYVMSLHLAINGIKTKGYNFPYIFREREYL